MLWIARTGLALAFAGFAGTAWAQQTIDPGVDIFDQGLVAPTLEYVPEASPEEIGEPIPYSPTVESAPAVPLGPGQRKLVLEARLTESGAPIKEGMTWRVFGSAPGADGRLRVVTTQFGGTTSVALPSGEYLVHAAFGRAGATKRVVITDRDHAESMVLDAGGLELNAIVGDEQQVDPDKLTFEVLKESETGDLETIVPKAAPGRVLRLSAGTYHVISRYGDVNAVVRADIEVEAGKLTEGVMRHTGAEVTLKLVSAEGGEALANTRWTVLTQDGVTVHESIGAFPSIVLAEGTYSAVADHQDRIYSRDFTIEAGLHRDVEVRLSDFVKPEPELPPNASYAPVSGGPTP